jgi:hypothetical protein
MTIRRLLFSLLLLPVTLLGCQTAPAPSSTVTGVLQITALAGPVCPVEQVPPDPGCAPRPVVDATVLVQPGDGRDVVVATLVTDEDGTAQAELPAGEYIVIGAAVSGLMGTPEPVRITVDADGLVSLDLLWDTGIR